MLTDAATTARIDVLPDRTAHTLEAWLRDRFGIEVAVRDRFAAYTEAVRRALPDAAQVADRHHRNGDRAHNSTHPMAAPDPLSVSSKTAGNAVPILRRPRRSLCRFALHGKDFYGARTGVHRLHVP